MLVLVAGLLALSPMTPQSSQATIGSDDYPARLKTAAQDSLADPWLFYNRECTSFVAWRLNHDAGVAFHNYYRDVHWGNASNWRYAANRVGVPVDDTPARGAVAWWAAGSPGSSRGHVAWVMSRTTSSITIEEYNYLSAGRYDRRTISTNSSMWPTAFLHFGKDSLSNTTAPSIRGVPQVGAKLTARPGGWTLSGATYTYRWLADGVAVRGATHRSFAPRAAQLGKRLQVRVTASLGDAKRAATSSRTRAVAPGDLQSTERPAITGTPQVGAKLTAGPGRWTPSGANYSYQWLADGIAIDGATHRSFAPRAAQLGQSLRVRVTASAAAMDPGTATSPRTDAVAPGELVLTERPTITGTPRVDTQLSATRGTWSPSASYTYQWNAAGKRIPGAVDSTFTPTPDQLGQRITVLVTASRDGYTTATSRSVLTGAVHRASFATTGPPTIAGTAQVDRPLTVSPGDWSPSGTPTYQWFVDGTAVAGATGSRYVPRPEDVRSQVTVQVRMTRPGYRPATSSSAATDAVIPGTFRNLSDPTIAGTPRVGLTLTANPGGWSPQPTLSFQWYADGTAIPGATGTTYGPTAAEVAKRLTVEVTARRPGYLTALTTSAPTTKVAPGIITSTKKPAISGSPVVGGSLTASRGTWTVKPSSVAYQWYADGVPIPGATERSYSLTRSVLDRRLTVQVTVSADGYRPASRRSAPTQPVVVGQVAFVSPPTLTGTVVTGRLLTADPGSARPARATASYTWLRSGKPIADENRPTYRLAAADVGHRIAVRITLAAQHWASKTARVAAPTRVRSVPLVEATSTVIRNRVVLRFAVTAPGIAHPDGRVVVTEGDTRVGTVLISGGRGRLALTQVPSGVHRYRLAYAGPLQTSVNRRLDVTVP